MIDALDSQVGDLVAVMRALAYGEHASLLGVSVQFGLDQVVKGGSLPSGQAVCRLERHLQCRCAPRKDDVRLGLGLAGQHDRVQTQV